jgi:FkbM family methyltransferase
MKRYLSYLLFILRQLPAWLFSRMPYQVRHAGQTFIVNPRSIDLVTYYEIYVDDQYATHTQTPKKNIVDIGANVGLFSLWSIAYHGAKKVLAIEMNQHNIACIKSLIRANHLEKKITLIPKAFYHTHTLISEQASPGFLNSCHQIDDTTPGRIETITLADIVKRFAGQPIDLLKVDIEGAEKSLMTPAQGKLLSAHVREIILEVHPQYGCSVEDMVKFLTRHGFVIRQDKHLNPLAPSWRSDTVIGINTKLTPTPLPYFHIQTSYLPKLVVGLTLLALLIQSFIVGLEPGLLLALFILGLAYLFLSTLTIKVDDQNIDIVFGGSLYRRRLALSQVSSARIVRNSWITGWGIRFIPGGWLYNVSGYDAVEVIYDDREIIRIGTDDPQGLHSAISQHIPQVGDK